MYADFIKRPLYFEKTSKLTHYGVNKLGIELWTLNEQFLQLSFVHALFDNKISRNITFSYAGCGAVTEETNYIRS